MEPGQKQRQQEEEIPVLELTLLPKMAVPLTPVEVIQSLLWEKVRMEDLLRLSPLLPPGTMEPTVRILRPHPQARLRILVSQL